jgi:hypothetical protein
LSCGLIVDRCIDNEKAGRITGGADTDGFGVLSIRAEVPAWPITTGAEWNGFDNFTGNSLSHIITPTITIVAESQD